MKVRSSSYLINHLYGSLYLFNYCIFIILSFASCEIRVSDIPRVAGVCVPLMWVLEIELECSERLGNALNN